MTRYQKGVKIELLLKNRAWKNGGWAMRAPASAKSSLPNEAVPKSPEQEEINIKVLMKDKKGDCIHVIDLGFHTHNLSTDLIFYDPIRNPDYVMVSEVKSVRQRRHHPQGKRVVHFYLLDRVRKKTHPSYGKIVKSSFATELEKALLIARRMNYMFKYMSRERDPKISAVATLIVYFVGREIKKKEQKELFFNIEKLLEKRTPEQTALKIERDQDGTVNFFWYVPERSI